MSAKTRTQAIDPTQAFATEEAGRIEALRTQVLPRLNALKNTLIGEANETFDFEVTQYSDAATQVSAEEVYAGLHPAEGDYSALRNVRNPAALLAVSATAENLGVLFRITGVAEWRLFIKALYQYRESLGEYIAEFEELYLLNSEGEEEAIEELDQFFAVDVDSDYFKASGCTIYFPGLEYPVENEEDFETITGDFISLFPLYWTLIKAAGGETVDMDRLLNG